MTVLEKINKIITEGVNTEIDSTDKLIYLAYYFGRELAIKEISDKHNKLVDEQKTRAKACRYHKMANEIIGDTFIYSTEYRQDMIKTFGNDITDF